MKRLVENERQLAKAEINSLHQQFQPHFLFNSLNSISALVKSQPEQARTMLHNLSDYLRMTIQKDKIEFNTIQEEIDYLNLYLSIEKVRFGHRLSIEINLQEDCQTLLLPSLILQPIVENAIKYGLYAQIGELTISINITKVSDLLQISVTNPYDETIVSATKGTGYGLASIKRKLKLFFKRDDLLSTRQENKQFTATLLIPQL
jgi:LytS/YehU family sensor histidine kinase